MASDNDHIDIVYEGNRNYDLLTFIRLVDYYLNDILSVYERAKSGSPNKDNEFRAEN